jgi:hypothetical protein
MSACDNRFEASYNFIDHNFMFLYIYFHQKCDGISKKM